MRELFKELKTLISIESPTGKEKKIADYQEAFYKKLGFFVKRIKNNLLVRIYSKKSSPKILLIGHLDTVPPEGKAGFFPKETKSRIYGRGAVDMKAGIACMNLLAKEIKKGKRPWSSLEFVFYEGEETSLPNGMTFLLKKKLIKGDLALILEPTDRKVQIGCLSRFLIKAKIKGKSSHSAYPWRGKNPLLELEKIIKKISQRKYQKVKYKNFYFWNTFSLVKIETPNATNVIPPFCEIYLDLRQDPRKKKNEIKNEVKKIIGEKNSFIIKDESPGFILKKEPPLFKKLFPEEKKEVFQAWSDIAQIYHFTKIPAVNFGPGKIEYAHSANENIEKKEFKDFYKLLKKKILS